MWKHVAVGCLAVAIAATACAGPTPGREAGSGEASRASAPKRITAAISGDPHTLYQKLNPSSTVRGVEELESLVHAGLSIKDTQSALHPRLAEAVPSLDNGLWRLFPDGSMETTWRIRPGARWHDGSPVTADDAVFTSIVEQDRELPLSVGREWAAVESVQAMDASTVTAKWKRPYIEADALLDSALLPKHLLERAYYEEKAGFSQLPFWTEGAIGAGPYRLREFVRGSHMVLEANDHFVLGRPRIDVLEVKFIVDPNTLIANLLAGTVEATLGRGISFDQALEVREQWRDGRVDMSITALLQIFPQLLTPSPAIIGNPDFRRALLHAINRQEMADTIQSGLTSVAHVFLSPEEREHQAIEPSIVRYDYDPRRAAQMIEGLGYTRGADGFFRDVSNQRPSVEIRATGTDVNQKTMFAVADYWQRIGVAVEQVSVPPQRASDLEYRATFPGFAVQRQGGDLRFLRNFHSAQARVPETRYTGSNNSRYRNPELDILIERYERTIPLDERLRVAGQVVNHVTDRVVELPLFFDAEPFLVANRILGARGAGLSSRTAWNAYEWDTR